MQLIAHAVGYRVTCHQFNKLTWSNDMENFFEQFQGADIERFTDCLTAIRKAGLTLDKHTMAGVNDSSGNVWVANEAWVGCVYCSIGFDVKWSYSCRECGEEFDFLTYAELEAFAEANQNDCTVCRTEKVDA